MCTFVHVTWMLISWTTWRHWTSPLDSTALWTAPSSSGSASYSIWMSYRGSLAPTCTVSPP